ncbi:MAG: oligopeptidase B, partial [Sphingobacterium sp.]
MQHNKNIQWPEVLAPIAAVHPYKRQIHGDTVIDDYYWMIDYFKKGQRSAEVIDYLTAENTYTAAMLKETESFQEDLFREMKSR